jgi:glycosyltransferase involved in cell wall biosynthesis
VDTLLEATALLDQLGSRVNVLLAGPIGEFNGNESRTETVAWKRAIAAVGARYLGRVPDSRLAGLFTLADLFVMPTADLEMQGMAALEAQACGTPVVASDHGGLVETVPRGCGVLFPPGDVSALAEAITSLLNDQAKLSAYGSAAREHARTYAWPRIVDRLLPCYEKALADK